MITRSEVKAHVQGLSEGSEEVGHKLGAPVRRDSVLGEDMEYKQLGEFRSGECIVCRDEDTLLGDAVHYDEDGGKTVGIWKLLNEIHGDGVPGPFQDRKLLEGAIWKVTWNLGSSAGGTGFAVIPDEEAASGPRVVPKDKG
ncbi:hypothetical protein FOMPIDRAFT_1135288 [Fomitopsis schrenkii]|uniref:Uncharacterized protein n=1 Tax=Fomitopsis schrenkii TaxID=2126942 RepID=S8F4L8_FOMSC|nr:hypothetical protein FOMPIDRAFT_1135288 [Fomitopsis schrenkii]